MAKNRASEARTDKHRKTHELIQTWVRPELKKAIVARAKLENRTLASLVRHELIKIFGVTE